MRQRLRDIPEMLRTPVGRYLLLQGANYRLWPLSSRLARLYRSTVVRNTRVIAVVGSFGKSTTVRAVSAVVGAPLPAPEFGNAWSSVAAAILRIAPRQRHAVIEVGIAAAGQMQGYARTVRPSLTVVTTVGSEHQRSLGSLSVTREEKAWMVRVLPSSGTAVLNGDDPNVMWMREKTNARVVTFGFGTSCDVRAMEFRLDGLRGTRFRVRAFDAEREVATRLLGRHMVYPALAAIAVAQLEGFALDETLSRLADLRPTEGRLQPILLPNGVTLLRDDFKSTLETIHSALDVFSEIPGRRIVVLGSVSEAPAPQRAVYQAIGERVARIASLFVVIGTSFEAYYSGARRGGMPGACIINAGYTPREAADVLRKIIQPGDVVLLKGRDTQSLDRLRLILEGRRVGCNIVFCNARLLACERCPMLEPGWGTHRLIMQPSTAEPQ